MADISRRHLLASTVAAGAAAGVINRSKPAQAAAVAPVTAPLTALNGHDPIVVRWLEGKAPAALAGGVTWGVPWPKGAFAPSQTFRLRTESGDDVPVQSWPIGWWPDGSVKWTAHAVSGASPTAAGYTLGPGAAAAGENTVTVRTTAAEVRVDTGVISVGFARSGKRLITTITRGGQVVASRGRLVAQTRSAPAGDETETVRTDSYTGEVGEVTVEQDGPVRAVVKVIGKHRRGDRAWLPFVVRFYLYAGSDGIRAVHSFVYDGDEQHDFVSGLGITFDVAMRGELHDRHIRLAGQDGGVLGEAVRTVTGLRRDPGAAVRKAQVAGEATPATSTWDTRVFSRLQWIPAFGDYSLAQLNANGFEVRKRTKAGQSWLAVDSGRRADGLGFVGSPSGGLAFGMRNFWQLHPTELQITGAASDTASATVWMWSPRAGAMDLRYFHDGLGQDTYAEQLDALEITYEDYEPGFDTPKGVARTTELMFWALPATPTAERFAELAAAVATPPLLVSTPEHNHAAGVFGSWSPVDRSTSAKAAIEDRLAAIFEHHAGQVDQRSWYGFWDYGDIMHTYDADRHVWRYDVGGYAWDNSELSTDLWLWYHYLRTGDAEAFRFAEAMTRHTGEVDVYHLGEWKGLGTRHGVMHWGDSAKQVRISNAGYRRFYYFLTADERVGDLLHDLIDADRTFLTLDPYRKLREGEYDPDPAALAVNPTTDWGALAGAWLAEWERNGDPIARTKLINGARTIAAWPNGWAQAGGLYDMADGKFRMEEASVEVGSLDAVFGLVEVMTELIDLIDDPEVTRQWTNYCRLYNATRAEQEEATGAFWGSLNLRQAYSRCTAYAASRLDDDALAKRAWKELATGHAGYPASMDWGTKRIEPPLVLNPVDETSFSTNASAQYGLAAIQCLALVGDQIS